MKITSVRSLRLFGPRIHGVGGKPATKGKIIVRIDTDAGTYGLGECEDFMGVREALAYLGSNLMGRDPLTIRPYVSEMMYGTLPPHPKIVQLADGSFRPGRFCPPTAVSVGPMIWGL